MVFRTGRSCGLFEGMRRALPLLAFGVSLARRGFMAIVSMGITALTVLVAIVITIVLAARGKDAPLHDVPLVASSAIAWGGGFLHAFAAAAHALRRDKADGIRELALLRTTSLRGYLVARVGGLAALLAIVVAGGTLLVGIVCALASSRFHGVPKTLQATLAAFVFALAWSAVVAPVAFAALGARSRVGGYLFLVGIVVVPELIASAFSGAVPESIVEVLSIPSALGALRGALAPDGFDLLRAGRAVIALAVFVGFALLLVRRDAAAVAQPEAEPS
jgi:hypothetical protein